MRTRIADELNRPDLVAGGQIASAIRSAVAHYAPRKFWFNTTLYDFDDPTVAGEAFYDLPAGVHTVEALYIDTGAGFVPIERESARTIADLNQGNQTSGEPSYFCELGGQIQLWCAPSGAWPMQGLGVVDLAELTADGDGNAWLVDAEELIRQRAKTLIRLDVINDGQALQVANAFAMKGGTDGCLGALELGALRTLKHKNVKKVARGRLRASG